MHIDTRTAVRTAAVALAVLAWTAPPARADLIRLVTGETLEGTAKESRGKVTIKLYKGKRTVERSEVKFIEEGELSWDRAKDMLRDIPKDGPPDEEIRRRLEVARFLQEWKQYTEELEDLQFKEYEKVLKLDADNGEAHEGLGHLRWEKWWFDDAEARDRFRQRGPKEEMEALGLVKYKETGFWERPEDIEAMQAGKVRYRGEWVTPDEKKRAEGYVQDDGGNWVYAKDQQDAARRAEIQEALGEPPTTVASSDWFRFVSWFPVGETAQLKDLADKTYRWYRNDALGIQLPGEDGPGEQLFTTPIEIFAMRAKERKDKWLEAFAAEYGYDGASIEFYRDGLGWHRVSPSPYFVLSSGKTEKNRERSVEEDFNHSSSQITSMIGRLTIERIRNGRVPAWLGEATGFLCEIRFNETADTAYVSKTEYRETVADKAGSKAKYYKFLQQQIGMGLDRTFRQIFTMELNRLDWADSLKAWSLLEFLLEKHRDEFRTLMRAPMPQPEFITPAQVRAAIEGEKPKVTPGEDAPKQPVKDEGPVAEEDLPVTGPNAIQVTENSKEQRAIRGAASELWLEDELDMTIDEIESAWKAWVKSK